MERYSIGNGRISATVKAFGAELCSVLDARGRQMLWQAGPLWPRHAPVLFPIVGRLRNDTLRHEGKTYELKQHGFARDLAFAWTEQSRTSCTLTLADSEQTRARYPFAFRLDIIHAVQEEHLVITYRVTNTGTVTLPASIGAHPAFNWPLAEGIAKDAHTLAFNAAELEPIRRVEGGLLRLESEPTPIKGSTLALSESLFVDDAIIMDQVASSAVRFAATGAPAIDFAWEGFAQLGLWSKPTGAPFLCIEPWFGYASPADFDGPFTEKPGLMFLPAGEARSFIQRISIGQA